MKRKSADPNNQLLMPMLAEMVPLGDNTFRIKVQKPDGKMDHWISASQVKQLLGGKVSLTTIYDFGARKIIKARRPTPHSWEFSFQSTMAYKSEIEGDIDVWESGKMPEWEPRKDGHKSAKE